MQWQGNYRHYGIEFIGSMRFEARQISRQEIPLMMNLWQTVSDEERGDPGRLLVEWMIKPPITPTTQPLSKQPKLYPFPTVLIRFLLCKYTFSILTYGKAILDVCTYPSIKHLKGRKGCHPLPNRMFFYTLYKWGGRSNPCIEIYVADLYDPGGLLAT